MIHLRRTLIGLFSIIPAKIAIAFHQTAVPQVIFVLGGDYKRMEFAAQFWQAHKDLDIWVSDFESNLNYNHRIFQFSCCTFVRGQVRIFAASVAGLWADREAIRRNRFCGF